MIGSTHKTLQTLIAPPLAEMGYRLVRLQLGSEVPPSLQIMAEPLSGEAMTVVGCAEVSRKVSRILDEADPIDSDYVLEVSSPGLDRPLVRIRDFERFQGFQAKVELNQARDGRRRFKGKLLGIKDDMIRILVDGEEVELPHPDIIRAKLLMTDDLIAAAEES